MTASNPPEAVTVEPAPERRGPPPMTMYRPPPAPPLLVAWRLLVWARAAAGYTLRRTYDRLAGRNAPTDRARAFRLALESLGMTGITLGAQTAIRRDLLPQEVCDELSRIFPSCPPFPHEHAIRRLEAIRGLPIDHIFDAFDPTPIASTPLYCTWQAVLIDGRRVAVRVRRPNIGEQLHAEWMAVRAVTGVVEWFADLTDDWVEQLKDEFREMLLGRLDFRHDARVQEMFLRSCKKARLKWLDAAEVVHEFTTDDVIVTGFAPGVLLSEVLSVVANQDGPALAQLAARGIQPEKLGKRLLNFQWWQFYENSFFIAELDPDRVVVQPGNRLVLFDLQQPEILSLTKRRLHREVLRRMAAADVSGAASAVLQMLAPLPWIDINAFTKRVEARLWIQFTRMADRQSPWIERTSTGIWTALLDTAREQRVPVRLETLQLVRGSINWDRLAGHLWPAVDTFREFHRYQDRAARRSTKAQRRQARRGGGQSLVAALAQNAEPLRRLGIFADSLVQSVPLEYTALSRKGSYAAITLIRAAVVVASLTTVLAVWLAVSGALTATPGEGVGSLPAFLAAVDVQGAAWTIITNPLYQTFLLLVAMGAMRLVQFRLGDRDGGE